MTHDSFAVSEDVVKAFEAAVDDPQFKNEWSKIDPDSPVAQRKDLERLVDELGHVSPDALSFIQSELKRQGVAAVFTPGAPTSEIVEFLREKAPA